jgi:predicted Zn-dependent peptidase
MSYEELKNQAEMSLSILRDYLEPWEFAEKATEREKVIMLLGQLSLVESTARNAANRICRETQE